MNHIVLAVKEVREHTDILLTFLTIRKGFGVEEICR